MRIKMLETRRGTEDGFSLKRYMRDETYEVADSLGRSFINSGWAMETEVGENGHD